MGFVGRNNAHEVIYDKTPNERFLLVINEKAVPRESIIVMMKNPSTTCINMNDGYNSITTHKDRKNCRIDRTTGNVYRILKKLSYDQVVVLNLYALYSSHPSAIKTHYSGNYNFSIENNYILSVLNQFPNSDILCAWGKSNGILKSDYNLRIQSVRSLFITRNLMEYDKTSGQIINLVSKYPLHGLMWQ